MSGGYNTLDKNGNSPHGGYHDREHIIPCEKICRVFSLPKLPFKVPTRDVLDDKYITEWVFGREDMSEYQIFVDYNGVICYKLYMDWKKWGLNKLSGITVQDINRHPEEFGKWKQYIEELEYYKATIRRIINDYEVGNMSYYIC